MTKRTYPFVSFTDANGTIVKAPSTYLPIRVANPHSGLSAVVYALIDTGADNCVFPKSLAVSLGHNFEGAGVQSQSTMGVSGSTDVFLHTFDLAILTPDRSAVFVSFEQILISCVPTEIPVLLGVADCLNRFSLTVDYPNMEITLKH
jgi:hypothetical protein